MPRYAFLPDLRLASLWIDAGCDPVAYREALVEYLDESPDLPLADLPVADAELRRLDALLGED
jgi:hypothetical protein